MKIWEMSNSATIIFVGETGDDLEDLPGTTIITDDEELPDELKDEDSDDDSIFIEEPKDEPSKEEELIH